MILREMKPKDVSQVASIQCRAWKEAYSGILPQDYLEFLDEKKIAERWAMGLELNADLLRMVAEERGRIAGYSVSSDAELLALYVDPLLWGKGIGQALLREVLSKRKSRLVWVLEKNTRARNFYEKAGAQLTTQKKISVFGGQGCEEVAYILR